MKTSRQLGRYTSKIGNNTIVVQCATHLEKQAEHLLKTLSKTNTQNENIAEVIAKQIASFGLVLHKQGCELLVCEPDFWGDPFNNVREDISCSLTILAKQNKILSIIGVKGLSTSFQQKIVSSQHYLKSSRLYLKREKPRFPDSSGWIINNSNSLLIQTQGHIFVYELLYYRTELTQVLSLPINYSVVFEGDTIESITNEKNENVWNIDKVMA
jgi:hypothetical protein